MKRKVNRKFVFFVLLPLFIGTLTFINVKAQENFSGTVKDKANNAISGATVLIADSLGYILGPTTTSGTGSYSLSVTLSGYSPYYLSASKTGYETDTKTVTSGGSGLDYNLYGYVDGYIDDSQNDDISGATVKCYRNTELLGSDTTDSNGYYYIQISKHPTKITAEKHGFRDYSQSISTTGRFNFAMKALKAIIVGISDYSSGTDLNYCDEDASDWYDQLDDLSYDCEIYGDGHTNNYPIYNGLATEANVRSAIQSLESDVGSGDTVCFIFSGHGGTNFWGKQYLLMQDNSKYKETEIENDLEDYDSGVDIFFFFDSCSSGGIISSLDDMLNEDYIYVATTCTKDGYGYDSSEHQNGLWTYYFLEYSWIDEYSGSRSTAMETVFDYALDDYPKSGDDTPQEYDGDSSSSFYL